MQNLAQNNKSIERSKIQKLSSKKTKKIKILKNRQKSLTLFKSKIKKFSKLKIGGRICKSYQSTKIFKEACKYKNLAANVMQHGSIKI